MIISKSASEKTLCKLNRAISCFFVAIAVTVCALSLSLSLRSKTLKKCQTRILASPLPRLIHLRISPPLPFSLLLLLHIPHPLLPQSVMTTPPTATTTMTTVMTMKIMPYMTPGSLT